MSHDDEKFLSRWSQRKIDAGKEPEDREENTAITLDETAPASSPEGEMLEESDFDDVDFEALDKSSDYTRFTKANVPGAIQKLALRKLWDSDPVFEVMDGMNDYDEDFTGGAIAGKLLQSAYKAGKGYLLDDDDNERPGETDAGRDKPPQKTAAAEPQPEPAPEVKSKNAKPVTPKSDSA